MTTVLIVLGVLALMVVVASVLSGRASGDRAVAGDQGEQRASERRADGPSQSTRVLGDLDEHVGGESGGRFRRNGHGDLHEAPDVEAQR